MDKIKNNTIYCVEMLECHPILLKNTVSMEQQVRQEKKEESVEVSPNLVMAPGKMRVIKRNGKVVAFDEEKIKVAIMKAFLEVEGGSAAGSSRIHDEVEKMTADIVARSKGRLPSGGTIHIEELQDLVEIQLMRNEHHKVARAYVLYREARNSERPDEQETVAVEKNIEEVVDASVKKACSGLENVDEKMLATQIKSTSYEGISEKDLAESMLMTARTLVEKEPNYSYVTARLLLNNMEKEVADFLGLNKKLLNKRSEMYQEALPKTIAKGIELGILSEELQTFDLDKLGKVIKEERDLQFTYLGLQTLYDRYFITHEEIRYELPQVFLMRVAMGLAIQEKDKNEKAEEFYMLLSSFDYMSSTPTLFNSGTKRPQLSSCYLTTVPDDLGGIYDSIRDNALLSKWAGGLGNDWTNVRALGARIDGTNGKSQGIVPFLKVSNDTAVAVNQGGKRKGAFCAYLECWHLDVEEFLELRKNTGDDRRRTHDMNTANWIPDLFMKRLEKDEEWTLFSPSDVPDLT